MNIEEESVLKELKRLSEQIGKNNDYIQATGGNTSCKINQKMWVKASGKALKDALNENIFVSVEHKKIINNLYNEKGKENKIKAINKTNLRVSIETEMHAIINKKFVIHSHPVDVIAQTVLPGAKNTLKNKLKDYPWLWIEYTKPGNKLAQKIYQSLQSREIYILILENHGLVVGGDYADEVINLHQNIVSLLFLKSRKYENNKIKLLESLVRNLREKGFHFRLPKHSIIHTLGTDRWSYELASCNPLYPDHLVFCGKKATTLDNKNSDAIEKIYCKESRYIILENLGVILYENCSQATEEMLEAQSKVNLKIPTNSSVTFLSDENCNELINWDAETYRINLAKSKERTS